MPNGIITITNLTKYLNGTREIKVPLNFVYPIGELFFFLFQYLFLIYLLLINILLYYCGVQLEMPISSSALP